MCTSLLSITLETMDKPHELSAFVLRLAQWKTSRSSNASMSARDEHFCRKLSSFIYEQGLRGPDLTQRTFSRHDFECIVSVVSDDLQKYDSEWLWDVIRQLQSNTRNNNRKQIDAQTSGTKLEWMDNEWDKFLTLSALRDEEIAETRPQPQPRPRPKPTRCTAQGTQCKHFEHVLGVLHFQQLCADRIAEDPSLLLQYVQHIDIYKAYTHLMTAHSDEEREKLTRVMRSIVRCDGLHCRAKTARKSKRIKECVALLRSHNRDGVSEYYPEFVDIMHLAFLHKIELV